MTWGYGFLYDMGYSDFAGSGIVHLTGGIGALAGAAVTGARKQGNISRFDAEGANPDGPYAPHNVPNAALGTFILWSRRAAAGRAQLLANFVHEFG